MSSSALGKKTSLGKKASLGRSLIWVTDLKYLSLFFKDKYNIETIKFNIYSNLEGGYIHIKNSSAFSKTVKPHLLSSQHNLLNTSTIKLNLFDTPGIHHFSSSYIFKRNLSTKKGLSNEKYTIKYKKEYELSLIQKEVIIGIILGDGFLDRAKPTHNTRLRIEQSYPEKEKYLINLYKLFKPMTTMAPTILTRKDKRTGTTTQSLYFRTLSMYCLNYYYDLFYKDKIKSIPRDLGKLLTARGLAFWIMDDGGKSVHNQTILHTRAFKLEDVKYIQSILLENFDLTTRLEEKKKTSGLYLYLLDKKLNLKILWDLIWMRVCYIKLIYKLTCL